jgi:large subunit ribosomal protein L21
MSYAIIRSGGKQFRVEPGMTLRVPKINVSVGDAVDFEVLAANGPDGLELGSPAIEGLRVGAIVVDHGRGDKIIVFKKKRRKQYKRKKGHRQDYTTIKIDS